MKLEMVTITGADASVRPEDLMLLSSQYPFVEWGILVSATQQVLPRFPYHAWIEHLQELTVKVRPMSLSLHVCGRWVRDLLIGGVTFPPSILHRFGRIQLNFHAENAPCNPGLFAEALNRVAWDRPVIFQVDGANGNAHMEAAAQHGFARALPLFDLSGGAGILPEHWPTTHWQGGFRGYAGGLSPDNLAEQLPLIAAAAGESTHAWIDLETHVRSDNDRQFDLEKVGRVLEIAAPFINKRWP